ncbi:MAG: endonuclease III domain-containing protein, partial [Conexivisphaera sp.]
MDVPREVLRRIELVKDSLLPAYEWYPSDPGSPRWWGGLGSAEEIAISAVLVQLSRWSSALASLEELRRRGLLDLGRLADADPE